MTTSNTATDMVAREESVLQPTTQPAPTDRLTQLSRKLATPGGLDDCERLVYERLLARHHEHRLD